MAGPKNQTQPTKETHQKPRNNQQKQEKQPNSWLAVRGLFGCKHVEAEQQQPQPQVVQNQKDKEHNKRKEKKQEQALLVEETVLITSKKSKKMRCSGSLCSNTKVMQRPEMFNSNITSSSSPENLRRKRAYSLGSSSNRESSFTTSSRSMKSPLILRSTEVVNTNTNSSTNVTSTVAVGSNSTNTTSVSSFKGIPFSRFSGCYECRMVVDPVLGFTKDPVLRSSICSCPDCGEIFMKSEYLELHQSVRHAVSELGPEDTSKNIVEIIFQSSWLRKEAPVCKIDRILKVHNTQRTISKFEEYRDSIKSKATKYQKKHPRCIADGNELLRFHCTTFSCTLGLNGSSNLCSSLPQCNVCSIIKNGFRENSLKNGILTTATSGKAHDQATLDMEGGGTVGNYCTDKRAMLVCRVIAGRVKKTNIDDNNNNNIEEYDSVAGAIGVYSNLDELYVFNSRAILPCFVVIYRDF